MDESYSDTTPSGQTPTITFLFKHTNDFWRLPRLISSVGNKRCTPADMKGSTTPVAYHVIQQLRRILETFLGGLATRSPSASTATTTSDVRRVGDVHFHLRPWKLPSNVWQILRCFSQKVPSRRRSHVASQVPVWNQWCDHNCQKVWPDVNNVCCNCWAPSDQVPQFLISIAVNCSVSASSHPALWTTHLISSMWLVENNLSFTYLCYKKVQMSPCLDTASIWTRLFSEEWKWSQNPVSIEVIFCLQFMTTVHILNAP